MKAQTSPVVFLLLAGLWSVHQSSPLPQDVPHTTQESFELEKFLGRWYEVAVVSTCPYYMQAQRDNPAIGKYELRNSTGGTVVHMRGTVPGLRQGTCKQIALDFTVMNHSGQFYHHFAKFNADVYSYVVDSDYEEYAMWVILSTEQPSGIQSKLVKLYSRAIDPRESVLTQYRALVRNQGLNGDLIIFKDDKGECDPINTNSPV